MKRIVISIILFLTLFNCAFTQDKNIDLPKTEGFELNYSSSSIIPIFSTYVNSKGDIYFEHIKLDNVLQLADTVNKYRSKLTEAVFPFASFVLYADQKLPYSTIDSIKSTLSSVFVLKIFYMTNHVENITSGVGRRNQPSMKYRKMIRSGESIAREVIREPAKELGIVKHPIIEMYDELYDSNFKTALELLKKFKYKKIELINDQELLINGKRVNLSNSEKIYQEIKDLDFYFLSSYATLSYGDYVKGITSIIRVLRKYKIDTPNVEISNELKRALEANNIRL